MEAQILSTFLWVYLSGSVICLTFSLIVRHIIDAHDLEDKRVTLSLTVASWLGVLAILISAFMVFREKYNNRNNNDSNENENC